MKMRSAGKVLWFAIILDSFIEVAKFRIGNTSAKIGIYIIRIKLNGFIKIFYGFTIIVELRICFPSVIISGFNSIDLVNVSMAKAKKSAGAQRSAVLILLCNFKVLSFCLPKMGAFIYRTNSIWCYNPCGGTVAANLYLCQKKILGRIQS